MNRIEELLLDNYTEHELRKKKEHILAIYSRSVLRPNVLQKDTSEIYQRCIIEPNKGKRDSNV